jgi:RNA 2',3'-cyclic 3'-phosphodiesterase
MAETYRAFIAFELSEEVREAVREVQARLRGFRFDVRWVSAENIHLTLRFLGPLPAGKAGEAAAAIADAAERFGPLTLSAGGLGVFPDVRRPRVLWVGIGGETEALRALRQALDHSLARKGFPAEDRPFRAHLTVGRVKGKIDPPKLAEMIEEHGKFEPVCFPAAEIVLFKSDLKPSGAVYTPLRRITLAGGSGNADPT